jgi:hypothetical protein
MSDGRMQMNICGILEKIDSVQLACLLFLFFFFLILLFQSRMALGGIEKIN